MANIIKTTIQFRRAKNAEWLQHLDVVPAAGEPCFDLDLKTLKIGDGETAYANLPAIGGVDVKITADGKSVLLEDDVFKLMGFDGAKAGAYPVKNADGTLGWVMPSTKELDDLKTEVATLKNGLKTIQDIVGPYSDGTTTLLSRVETLEDNMDGVDAKIDAKIEAFASMLTPDSGKIDTLMELIDYVEKHDTKAIDMANDITALKGLVGNVSVEDRISAAVAGKVDKVEGMGLSANNFTNELLDKLNTIEAKAQVNTIEKISVGGSILDIIDKTIDIPVAGPDHVGVVKSATGANKVSISNSGEMSVNKVNIHSVFVPIGEELVLDGGGAVGGSPVYPTRIGNIGYNSISDAVNYADNGDVVTLQDNVNMGTGDNDHLVVNAANVTIDLGGKMFTANGSSGAIKVEGGVTTLNGSGTVNGTLGSDKYSMAVWADNGTVVINDGIYKNETDGSVRGTDLIYASANGCIEINGGTFEAAKPEWTLNVKDADYKAGTAKIIVKGGSFKGFDPANNNAEGPGTNFLADGYKSVKKDGYYVVMPI